MIEQSLNSAFSFKEINAYIILAFFSMVFSKTGSLYRTKTVNQIKDKKKKEKEKNKNKKYQYIKVPIWILRCQKCFTCCAFTVNPLTL